MENEVQPLTQAPTPVSTSTNWVKIIVLILLGIVIIAGSVFAGIQLGKKQMSNQQPITNQPIITPTKTVVNPTTLPTAITNAFGTLKRSSLDVSSTPIPTPDPTADWKIYINQKLGITVKYPSNLFFKEIDPNYGMSLAFDSTSNSETPGSYFDSIKIISDANATFEFNTLQNAVDGKSMTGYDLHKACGVTVTKLKNIKFGTFEGVEYIFDGSNPPSDCGRDLIGYEHTILIRKSDSMFIKILNGSIKKENTNQHDLIFNQILSTFKFSN